MSRGWVLVALVILFAAGCRPAEPERAGERASRLRLGYMANLTHAQAVLGVADGSLERAAGVKVQTRVFPSGPAGITALFAGEIDMLYVGPSPAVNGYVRSEGKALRVVAGAASGGAVFVVRRGVDPTGLRGARLATPGVANTQDVALRHLLASQGLRTREQGGDVRVTPLPPAEILGLFARGDLDGAWVPEPWGARLVREAGARLAIDERDLWPGGRYATTLVAVSTPYLEANPEVVRGFLAGHVAITRWMQEHPESARGHLQAALAELQGKPIPDEVLADAWTRVDFVYDPMAGSVAVQADRAWRLGLLGARQPNLDGLYDLTLLQEVAP